MSETTEITIEYLNEEKTEWLIDYGAKIKARYKVADLDELTEEQIELLVFAQALTIEMASIKSLVAMEPASAYRLVERIARTFCTLYSPMQTAGLEKAYIRWEILRIMVIMVYDYMRANEINELNFADLQLSLSEEETA